MSTWIWGNNNVHHLKFPEVYLMVYAGSVRLLMFLENEVSIFIYTLGYKWFFFSSWRAFHTYIKHMENTDLSGNTDAIERTQLQGRTVQSTQLKRERNA